MKNDVCVRERDTHTHMRARIKFEKLEICLLDLETILESCCSLFSLSLVCGPAKASSEAEVCLSDGRGTTGVSVFLVTAAGERSLQCQLLDKREAGSGKGGGNHCPFLHMWT